jgi:hypothetical protein
MKSILVLIFTAICSAPPFKRDEGFIDYAGNFEAVYGRLPPDDVNENEIHPVAAPIPDDNSDNSGLVDLAGIPDRDSDQSKPPAHSPVLVESLLDVYASTTSESFSTPDEVGTAEEDAGLIEFDGIP